MGVTAGRATFRETGSRNADPVSHTQDGALGTFLNEGAVRRRPQNGELRTINRATFWRRPDPTRHRSHGQTCEKRGKTRFWNESERCHLHRQPILDAISALSSGWFTAYEVRQPTNPFTEFLFGPRTSVSSGKIAAHRRPGWCIRATNHVRVSPLSKPFPPFPSRHGLPISCTGRCA